MAIAKISGVVAIDLTSIAIAQLIAGDGQFGVPLKALIFLLISYAFDIKLFTASGA